MPCSTACSNQEAVNKRTEEKLETKHPAFNGELHEGLVLWQLRVEAAVRGKELIDTPTDKTVKGNAKDDAMLMLIAALGDSLLRTVQICVTPKETWSKFQNRHAGGTSLNKCSVS